MEKRNGEVIMDATNKWSNLEYFKLTGLREYAPYMMGGGCAPRYTTLTSGQIPVRKQNPSCFVVWEAQLHCSFLPCTITHEEKTLIWRKLSSS